MQILSDDMPVRGRGGRRDGAPAALLPFWNNPGMQLNSDFSKRVVIQSQDQPWVASPAAGIERRLLHRDGAEVAQATSIVRYAPGAQFESHRHALGEEILVLEGDFFDASGSYGPGTYLKNPPGSAHAPGSRHGCTLFVKLRHLEPDDQETVAIDIHRASWFPGLVPGLTVLPLAHFGTRHTAMVRWAPGTRFNRHRHLGGEEIYVVDGVFSDEHGRYPAGTWIRGPHLSEHTPFTNEGCTIFVKTGHLPLSPQAGPF